MTEAPYAPTWGGINLQTAENLKFGSTQQLFRTYLSCVPLPVTPPMLLAWLMGSYKGALSPEGFPHGEGSATLLGALTYTGTFKHGLLHGHGTLSCPPSWSFTGSFSYNCIHGSGLYQWDNGAYYNGQVYQGLPHGEGLMFTGEEDCCTYEGAWKHGLRHGQGKLTYDKNSIIVYEGRWVLDRKHGDGYHTYDFGSTYKGGWSQGKRHGKGRLVSVSNGKPLSCPYQGELGRFNLTRCYIYEGDWIDDLSSGRGKSIWMGNEQEETSNRLLNCYVGDFNRGLRHGCGTFYYASGAMYKGDWEENKKHGSGCFINESGTVLHGDFVTDRCLQNEGTTVLEDLLQAFLESEDNPALLKERISNVLLRHNSVLNDVFSLYSNMTKGDKPILLYSPQSLLLSQVWQLCYEAKIVQCDLGLAQIDWLLKPQENSWDNTFEIHKQVDRLVRLHLVPLLSKDYGVCSSILKDVDAMQSVFDGYAPQLQKLFNGTLRGIGTSDDTITLRALDLFFQRYKPQWGLQRERLLFALIKGLYQIEIGFGDDGATFLDNNINLMEFQVAIYIYATAIKDPGTNVESFIMLNNLIKEVILPNLSTDLESLLNEDTIPNLPNINTKGANGNASSKTTRSVPGSKRSTPREGKVLQGAKSAPQTPLKKKT